MSERLTISIENDLSAECVDVLVEDSEGTLTISLHLIDALDLANSIWTAVLAHKRTPEEPDNTQPECLERN